MFAAAGYRRKIAQELLKSGANVAASNRKGAVPLHYAADGGPAISVWNSSAQAEIISILIDAAADPDALEVFGSRRRHRDWHGKGQ
jgi:ankyrin repeat protein